MNKSEGSRQAAYKRGLYAEGLAALYFRVRGYRIVCRRYKTPVGEIDLIVEKKGRLVAVEVKTRSTLEEALCAVTPRGRARIEKALGHFLMRHPAFSAHDIRFDVIAGSHPFCWRHLDNAWEARS
ncbi:MAG: YraN family protein [Alphaproteobacteria bacterium]|nr:YraN family protein [Alphaproteobacteria bacterium]